MVIFFWDDNSIVKSGTWKPVFGIDHWWGAGFTSQRDHNKHEVISSVLLFPVLYDDGKTLVEKGW